MEKVWDIKDHPLSHEIHNRTAEIWVSYCEVPLRPTPLGINMPDVMFIVYKTTEEK